MIEKLLPYYERELSLLREHAAQFAQRYPKIAGRLQITGESVGDPHIERLLEGVALLSSRVNKKLEDEYPQFTDALLNLLYPHYLKPFPSCGIIELLDRKKLMTFDQNITVDKGTILTSAPVNNVKLGFTVAYKTLVSSAHVASVTYEHVLRKQIPNLHPDASSLFTITLSAGAKDMTFQKHNLPYLRIFLDCDPALCTQIRELMFSQTIQLFVQHEQQRWQEIPLTQVIKPVGFKDEESLLLFDARSAQVYRLLTEFFAFPEKFNFLDFQLDQFNHLMPEKCQTINFYFVLNTNKAGFDPKLVDQISARHFSVNCSPVINLYKKAATPINLNHQSADYPLILDVNHPKEHELYAIDSVYRVVSNDSGPQRTDIYHPFYHLKFSPTANKGRYWSLNYEKIDEDFDTGLNYQISVTDENFKLEELSKDSLSVDVMVTNRDLASLMPYGNAQGDLFAETNKSSATYARFVTKPTHPQRFPHDDSMRWRLISHLNLNHFSLLSSRGELLKEMLSLYNITQSAENNRLIDSIIDVTQASISTRLPGKTYSVFVKGIEIRVKVDRQALIGTGETLFAQFLDLLFGMYVHANSFTQVVLICSQTSEEIIKCPPRNGHLVLV